MRTACVRATTRAALPATLLDTREVWRTPAWRAREWLMLWTLRCAALALVLSASCTGGIDRSAHEGKLGDARGDGDGKSDGHAGDDSENSSDGAGDSDDDQAPGGDSDEQGDGDDSGSVSEPDEPASGGAGDQPAPVDDAQLEWRSANLTNYESYPEPGSEECIEYSGCEYAGYFAAFDDQQSEAWVMSHNIAAVHLDNFAEYELKTLRLRDGEHEIDVVVYDACSDADCDGCCTENAKETGFLIDLEKYTAERFGTSDGIVEWACIDC